MKVVCIDTNITFWGIKEFATPGQELMIGRTKRFIASIDNSGDKIMIPSVVVGEFLLGVTTQLHMMTVNLLQRGFIIEPYDLQASLHFARIWRTKMEDATIEVLQNEGATRTKLRADCMIVATAVAKGAACIYSHDGGIKRFASGQIACDEIPDIPVQTSMFDNEKE